MNALTDQQLLREYAVSQSDSAFRELVRRHIDLVHSAARRLVRDSHTAEDVTQAVFTALSTDARKVSSHPVLAGWLHKTTHHLSTNVIRADARRRVREQQAIAMNAQVAPDSGSEPVWDDIASHLDVVLGELSDSDRDAVILRYFQKRSAKEIATTLGITAEAAQKRVNRAIERLRESFERRGITGTGAGITAAIGSKAVQAAPSGLAATIVTSVLASSIATTTTTTTTMIILQKVLIPAAAVVLGGTWVHQNQEVSRLRAEIDPTLQATLSPGTGTGSVDAGEGALESGVSIGTGEGAGSSGGGVSFGGKGGAIIGGASGGFGDEPEPISLDQQGRPTTGMVEKLELSDTEVTALEAAVLKAHAEASAEFKTRLKLTSSEKQEDGYHYFFEAPARSDRGKALFDSLAKAYTGILGEDRGQEFLKAMDEHAFVGAMGKYDMKFDFRRLPEPSLFLGTMSVSYQSLEPGSGDFMAMNNDSLKGAEERFGKVFDIPEPPEPPESTVVPQTEAPAIPNPESR